MPQLATLLKTDPELFEQRPRRRGRPRSSKKRLKEYLNRRSPTLLEGGPVKRGPKKSISGKWTPVGKARFVIVVESLLKDEPRKVVFHDLTELGVYPARTPAALERAYDRFRRDPMVKLIIQGRVNPAIFERNFVRKDHSR